MPLNAFQPQGNTKLIAVTTDASAAVQVSTGNITGARITADNTVYMAWASSSSVTATVTTTATAGGTPLMFTSSGTRVGEIFTLAPNAWVSFITESTATNVWVTPGYGF